jgi:hypothetical protein
MPAHTTPMAPKRTMGSDWMRYLRIERHTTAIHWNRAGGETVNRQCLRWAKRERGRTAYHRVSKPTDTLHSTDSSSKLKLATDMACKILIKAGGQSNLNDTKMLRICRCVTATHTGTRQRGGAAPIEAMLRGSR